MDREELRQRTKRFALSVVQFTGSVSKSYQAQVMARQLLRAGVSVGANYRAALRAKSVADYISKMGTVEEETDECLYWLELLGEGKIVSEKQTEPLRLEADQLLAIFVASIKTAKGRLR